MRLILWLAAGSTAAAMATAAPAWPGSSGSGHGGGARSGWVNGGGHQGGKSGWANNGGHHGGKGVHGRPGNGWVGDDGHRGRHHRRHGRFREGHYAYYGGGIAGPVGEVGRYGNGFFNGGGGEIRLRGGRAHFDYDRSYPYEWGPAARGRGLWDEGKGEAYAAERPPRCTFESGVRVCRGW